MREIQTRVDRYLLLECAGSNRRRIFTKQSSIILSICQYILNGIHSNEATAVSNGFSFVRIHFSLVRMLPSVTSPLRGRIGKSASATRVHDAAIVPRWAEQYWART